MPQRNAYALFPAIRIPRNAAELRFARMLGLLWMVRIGVVAVGLILLHRAGVL